MNVAVDYLSQAQRERLAFLEMRAYFTGELRRADIEARFGIKPAASWRDLSANRDLEPGNLDYDVAARCYRPTKSFQPLFEFSSDRVLAWLLQGFGDGLDLGSNSPLLAKVRVSWSDPTWGCSGLSIAPCAQRGRFA